MVLFIVGLLTLPHLVGQSLATEILILGVFAMSFNLLFGFTGLLSFGHVLFFGVGAYMAGLLSIETGLPFIMIILAICSLLILISLVIGLISLKLNDIYFAIITLAFAQLFFELAFFLDEWTGGADGLVGVSRPSVFGFGQLTVVDPEAFFYLTAAVVLIIGVFLYMVTNSLFGRTLKAVRDNEGRTRALGVNTYRVKAMSFVIASTVAGIAGVLFAYYLRFVSPNLLHWSFTGDAVLYTIVGGVSSIFSPLLGALGIIFLEKNLFVTEEGLWNLTIGILLIATTLFAREGLLGVLNGIVDYTKEIIRQYR